MKIAACLILYQPEESVLQNIKSYIHYVEKIYIIDNSEHSTFNLQPLSEYEAKTLFINDGNNEGIAKRLNAVCDLAINDGYDFLLTMDQDSYFDNSAITQYLKCIEYFIDKARVSIFGISYQLQSANTNCTYTKVKHLITSGSIVNLDAYKFICGFDENLFIDFVDTDYCFKSILKGYDVIELTNIFMHHEIGITHQATSFKTLKLTKRSIHSSVRLYYMIRNFQYINKKYKAVFKEELAIYKKDLITRIKNKLLYHSNRYETLKCFFQALKDYRNNKMGKQI